MKKSVKILVFMVIMASLVLGGCSQAAPEPSEPAANAQSEQEENVAEAEEQTAEDTTNADEETAEQPEAEVAEDAENSPIKIGLNLPLTGSLAFLGEGYKMGVMLAIEDLGGSIEGHPIETYDADNKGTATDSVNAVRQLTDVNQVQVMVGGGASSATLASMPIILEGEIPSVDGSSTNPTIYNQLGEDGNSWLFRIATDDLIMGQGFSDYIAERAKTVSFIADDNQFGRGAGEVYLPALPIAGVDVVSEDYFDPATTDYRPALTKIKATGADAILIVMTDQSCATLMRQLREVGLTQQIFSRGSCTTGLFNQLTEDDPTIGEGIVEFSFFMEGNDPQLAQHFSEYYNEPITAHRMAGYYAMYYAIAPAIENVIADGKEITPENIRDAIAALNVETPGGLISFDEHNQAYTNGSLTTNEGGKQVFLEEIKLKPVDHTGF